MKKIKIYTGNIQIEKLFEKGLHPISQVEKVKDLLKSFPDDIAIYTNSPFIVEAFNKYGKEGNYVLEFYFENNKLPSEIVFGKFSKVFEGLLFGEELTK